MKNKLEEILEKEKIANLLEEFYSKLNNELEAKNIQEIDKKKLAKYFDHTNLKPDACAEDIEKLCYEAKEYGFYSVCVNPSFVDLCKDKLQNSEVKVCTVIGFPLGATTTETKVFEAEQALKSGAEEIDMVLNIGKLKDCNYEYVFNDIQKVTEKAKQYNAKLKVILETCLLSDQEKIKACLISKEAGADFVKTSTGFSKSGATAEDISLMRFTVGNESGVKASGGIRTFEDAEKMIKAGANRIGASASVEIVLGIKSGSKGY